MNNSGYTLWGTSFTPLTTNGRVYTIESINKAIKEYLLIINKRQRKEKLEKLNELTNRPH